MKILALVLSAVSLSLSPSVIAGQEHSPAVEASFNQFRSTWRDAWNRRDTKTLASLMAEDIDWIAADGTWLKGRKAWQDHHDRLFAHQFKTAKWKLLDERVQLIDSRTAITISATEIGGDTHADGTAREPRRSVGTRIITKSAGKWLLKVAHNTIIQGVDMK
jgi:uncharacterized protein (TIGR02246 family)